MSIVDRIELSTEVTSAESALATTVDGETVILETDSGTYYGLNEVATAIWSELEETATVEELRDAVLATYDVGEEACERDLEAVLTTMASNGIVELGDGE